MHGGLTVDPRPAKVLWRDRLRPPVGGREVATRYGLLAHYTSIDLLRVYEDLGGIGTRERGIWLTPSPISGCLTPYDLGLVSPRNLCMLIDVSELAELWGPGTSDVSEYFPTIWCGGGIEFYYPDCIGFSCVRDMLRIEACGDIRP